MIAVLLLVTLVAMLSGAQALPVPAAHPNHPSGCHGHGPEIPAPGRTGYQCCVGGHHAAIPNASFSPRPVVAQICALHAGQDTDSNFVGRHSVALAAPSYSPPGGTPLRL
ncbi:MAG: hypothetical protein WA830_13595 [Candidatus Sulfotelmatobacter sp.]